MLIKLGLYRFELRWIPSAITLVAFVLLARLGFWQLERGAQKQARLDQIAQFEHSDRMSFSNLLKVMDQQDPTGVEVTIDGQFVPVKSWLLDNKIVKGQPGYDVLLALQPEINTISNKSDNGRVVLVNMGWVQGNYADRQQLPTFVIPAGPVSLTAFVKANNLGSFSLSDESSNNQPWPLRTQQIDLQSFAEQSGLRFYPFMLYADHSESWGFIHHYQPVVMPPEKHQAYALQWFLLAVAVLIVFLFASKVTIEEKK